MLNKVIMNPAYKGSLHLKILETVIKNCPKAEIVNLSPIRWLQDPMLKYKKVSVYNKYKDTIVKHIADITPLDNSETSSMFDIQMGQLGIYYITEKGGWTLKDNSNSIIDKVEEYCKKSNLDSWIERGDNHDKSNKYIHVLETYGGNSITGTGYVKPFGYSKPLSSTTKGKKVVPDTGITFKTEEEAKNFANSYKTKLLRYIQEKATFSTMHLCFYLLPWLGDYTHPWTDKDLYEYFSLTDEEIAVIEKELTN